MKVLIINQDKEIEEAKVIGNFTDEILSAVPIAVETRLPLVLRAIEYNNDLKYVILPADLAAKLITNFFKK